MRTMDKNGFYNGPFFRRSNSSTNKLHIVFLPSSCNLEIINHPIDNQNLQPKKGKHERRDQDIKQILKL